MSQSESDMEHHLRNLEQENQVLQRWLNRATESLQNILDMPSEKERLEQIDVLHSSLRSLQNATQAKRAAQSKPED